LRPGAVDQELFKAHLAAAQKEAALVPPSITKAPAFAGIPTLTSAQLAALGAVEEPLAGELVIDIPAPNPADPGAGGSSQPGLAGGLQGGAPAAPLFARPPTVPAASDAAPDAEARAASDAPSDAIAAPGTATPASAPSAPQFQASVERGPIPGSRRGADGAWELTRLPDKDERDMLRGQKWRVVESERSRQLFLGPDGKFGWDDFLDVINPLQHIPLINLAYRAVTGDEIYGAARLVDMAFGPMAGASTAIDLAFRDMTGESMASNAVAALFGPGEQPAGDVGSISTASGRRQQMADAGTIRRGSNE
jgi:hypothetical protein